MTFERAQGLLNRGLARPQYFSVRISRNENNAMFSRDAADYLEFYCVSASLPEIAHDTVGASGQGYNGMTRQVPTLVTYGKPFTIEVIERNDYIVRKNLQAWFDRTARYNTADDTSQRMAYYDKYTCDIRLTKLEYPYEKASEARNNAIEKGKLTSGAYRRAVVYDFKNAYPTLIAGVQLNTESQNNMLRYNVDFNYETYYVRYDLELDE